MAPVLERVYNGSTKRVYIFMNDGKSFAIDYGESVVINDYITADSYTKIDIDDPDVYGYVMKYNDYNIMLNDPLGETNGVADYALHIWGSGEPINLQIHPDNMQIWCNNQDLGVYQSDGEPKYYYSVTATHVEGGGITVTGFEPRGGIVKVPNVEDEASRKMKGSHADDKSTSKTI